MNSFKTHEKNSYDPTQFKAAISNANSLFRGVAANDSKDLINFLLETVHRTLNTKTEITNNAITFINQENENEMLNNFIKEYYSTNRSAVSDTFYGILETISQCDRCKTTKYNFQIYSFLEFPLDQVARFHGACNRNMDKNGNLSNYIYKNGTPYTAEQWLLKS